MVGENDNNAVTIVSVQ